MNSYIQVGFRPNLHMVLEVVGRKLVHPVTSIRRVVSDQIYILLRLFVGWAWSGKKTTARIDVISKYYK